MRITVETYNPDKFNILMDFLRINGYKIQIEKPAPLTDYDWIIPGRPATDEEHEAMALAMENDDINDTLTTDRLKKEMQKWIKEITR
ncbi:MAG: hypothetical protein HY738_02035 [Bacteroidia bacterium]|nr:hypothetical protein [Bacteroidia bacterium]